MKTCPTCKQMFPATTEYFYMSGDYLNTYCKKCHNKKTAEIKRRKREERRKTVALEFVAHKFDQTAISENEKHNKKTYFERDRIIKEETGSSVRIGTMVDEERSAELKRNILSALDADPGDLWAWRYRRDIGVLLKECEELRKTRDDLVRRIHSLKQGV